MDRRFRLQSVLNFRRDREEALQMELSALLAEERAERERLSALREHSTQAMDDLLRLQQRPRADVSAIEQGFLYLDALAGAIAAQTEIVARASERAELKRQELIAAMQARKAMDKLKEHHDRAYAAWVRQVEERTIDDLVTGRYNRRVAAGETAVLQ